MFVPPHMPVTDVQNIHVVENLHLSQPFGGGSRGHFLGLKHIELSQGHMPGLSSVLSLAADDLVDILVPGLKEL